MCRQVPTPERSAPDNLLVYCFQCTQWAQNSNLGNLHYLWTEHSDQIKIIRIKWPVPSRCPESRCLLGGLVPTNKDRFQDFRAQLNAEI